MRIIAAVASYNCSNTLVPLVGGLLKDTFDEVYVLDDCSSDNSLEDLRVYLDRITLIAGESNSGPAGNRNRILPELKEGDIIVFIDGDMEIKQRTIAKTVAALFEKKEHAGIIGGYIQNKKNKPMTYNYGVLSGRVASKFGICLEWLSTVLPSGLKQALRPFSRHFTLNLDIRYSKPVERKVGWVAEGLLAIRGDLFKELNGFDEALRYHEGQELAYRVQQKDYEVWFSPAFSGRHLEANVRSNRTLDNLSARRKFYKKVALK